MHKSFVLAILAALAHAQSSSDIAEEDHDNRWSSGPILDESGIVYEVSTDWFPTGGIDDETHYHFGLHLDLNTAITGLVFGQRYS